MPEFPGCAAATVGLILLLQPLAAGSPAAKEGSDGELSAAGSTPTLDALRQATYVGIDDLDAVTLSDGVWQGAPFVEGGISAPRVELSDLAAIVDLDGDGIDETVVGLIFSAGGTGTFLYLAAMAERAGEIVNLGTVLVGDRVDVMRFGVEGREAILEAVFLRALEGVDGVRFVSGRLLLESRSAEGDTVLVFSRGD